VENIPISEGVIAALIGGVATMATAFFQLIASTRKQSAESRSRRKTPWLLIFALMLTSAVGGFAYSEFRNWAREDKTDQLRAELNTKLTQLAAVTAQPQFMRDTNPLAGSTIPVPSAFAAVPASEQVREATINLPACKGQQVGFATDRPRCVEADALRVAVCVAVPAGVQVKGVELFARADDSQQAWADSRLAPEQAPSNGRFDAKHTERAEADGTHQVCQSFSHWDSDKGRSVRMVVRFGA
jgi:hypothetical protein